MRAPSFVPIGRHLRNIGFAVLVALALAGCGIISHPTAVDGENEYVDAGPITYQVQLSRELNQYAPDDREFLAGVSAPAPAPDQMWFGIWMWALNQTKSNQTTTDTFDIVDSAGNKYYPVPINSQVNPLAWTSQTLEPKGTEPAAGSAASSVPPQGGLVLFKLNNSVYSNRPLTLQIYAPGVSKPSTVSLDL